MAGCVATSSLAAQVSVDAWLLHQSLVRDVAANGLLLADEAILRGDDDPAALVDDSLRVDTGVGGLRGAARLRLASGLPVLRVGGQVRALRMPAWLHALLRGALAAWVAVLCARALANWRTEPRCPTCGGNLERTVKLGVSEVDAQAIAAYWRDLRSALGPADDTAIGAGADTAGAITGDATGDATADGPPLPAIHIAHQGRTRRCSCSKTAARPNVVSSSAGSCGERAAAVCNRGPPAPSRAFSAQRSEIPRNPARRSTIWLSWRTASRRDSASSGATQGSGSGSPPNTSSSPMPNGTRRCAPSR